MADCVVTIDGTPGETITLFPSPGDPTVFTLEASGAAGVTLAGDVNGPAAANVADQASGNVGGVFPIHAPVAADTSAGAVATSGAVRLPNGVAEGVWAVLSGGANGVLAAADGAGNAIDYATDGNNEQVNIGGSATALVSVRSAIASATGGAQPAQSGQIRIPNDTSVSARNAADTADVALIELDASDAVQVGSSPNASSVQVAGNAGSIISLGSSTSEVNVPVLGQALATPAFVTANGAAGTLEYVSASAVGGLGLPAPGTPAYNPAWYAETDIYWDPAGTAGGSDSNSGTVIGSPVLTFKEIVRRYGSDRPTMNYGQNVTVHQLTSQPASQDPVFFAPKISGGGYCAIVGTLIANGSPSSSVVVTPKARGGPGTLLQVSSFGTVAAGNLLFNSTRNSYAFVDTIADGEMVITQPISAALLTTPTSPALAEDNSWATGDTMQAYTLPSVNLKQWRPEGGDVVGSAFSVGWVQFVNIADASGGTSSEFTFWGETLTVLSACTVASRLYIGGGLGGRGAVLLVMGCRVVGLCAGFAGSAEIYGGVLDAGLTNANCNLTLDGDIIVRSSISVQASYTVIGAVYLDNFTTNVGPGMLRMTVALWGPGSLALYANAVLYNNTGTTWAATLLINGALSFGGTLTTGSYYTAATGLWVGAVALSAANFDTHNGLNDPQTGARFCGIN